MPRYFYTQLKAMCFHVRSYGTGQMREAVAYLKTQPQTAFTGLCATVDYRNERFGFLLGTDAMLSLEQIAGKTEAQVWETFDSDIDRQVSDMEYRFKPDFRP